jgi:DNA-binding GntR family transcriptional regulator
VAGLAARNIDEGTAEKIRKTLDRVRDLPDQDSNLVQYTRAEIDFHFLLLEAAGNEMLKNMMQTVDAHLQIIRLRTVVLPGRARKTVAEHREILEAVMARDPSEAEHRMRKHIESVRRVALENIDAMV